MDRVFTVAEARQLLPEVLVHADEVIEVRADLVELQSALREGAPSPLGGLPEAKALEARLSELLGWFANQGLDVKGIAPLLLDFPARLEADTADTADTADIVLLCWLEGERDLRWYHRPEFGFAGRRHIPDSAR